MCVCVCVCACACCCLSNRFPRHHLLCHYLVTFVVQEASAIEDVVRPPVNEQGHPPEEPTGQAPSDGYVVVEAVQCSSGSRHSDSDMHSCLLYSVIQSS